MVSQLTQQDSQQDSKPKHKILNAHYPRVRNALRYTLIEAIYVQHRESPVPPLPPELAVPADVEIVILLALRLNPDGLLKISHALITLL